MMGTVYAELYCTMAYSFSIALRGGSVKLAATLGQISVDKTSSIVYYTIRAIQEIACACYCRVFQGARAQFSGVAKR
jgi:hypothetical protein